MAISKYEILVNDKGEERLVHGDAFFPVACYHDDLLNEPVPWHWHDELEVALVTEGQAVVAAASTKTILKAGDGFFVNAAVLHSVWDFDTSACRLHSMVFKPRLVGGGADSVFWQKYLQPILTDRSQAALGLMNSVPWQNKALTLIELAWQALASEDAGFEFSVRSYLSEVIFLLSSQRPQQTRLPSSKILRDGERIKKMLQYIQENYAEPISNADIAASALISESECLRCFRSTIGTSPMQYVKQFRIQKASDFLLTSDLNVAEIAGRCGFLEMSYFAKTFKEERGLTPTEYRKQKRRKT